MTCKCVFVGEAWGEAEARFEVPFIGSAGQELFSMLGKTGFHPDKTSQYQVSPMTMIGKWTSFPHPLLNVFNERPSHDSNDVQLFYAHRKDNIPLDASFGPRRFGSGNFHVKADKAHHIHKLHKQLKELKPNLIIPMGATACWALGLGASIGKLRGFVHETPFGKTLPIYHPAAILRNWSLRAITLLDLTKARREMKFPGFRLIEREIWTEPTINDLWNWWHTYGIKSPLLAVDIETLRNQQISEVGFASDKHHALHIPFVWEDKLATPKKYHQWWSSTQEEVKAWEFVKYVCESAVPKIGQNLKYDAFWLAKEMGIAINNWQHDTMVGCHAWQPELGKSLYDLGAMFLDEKSWKSIRKDTGKAND